MEPPFPLPALSKLDKAWQEARQRLTCTCGRDEEGGSSLLRQFEQGKLVRAGLPALPFKPASKGSGQNINGGPRDSVGFRGILAAPRLHKIVDFLLLKFAAGNGKLTIRQFVRINPHARPVAARFAPAD